MKLIFFKCNLDKDCTYRNTRLQCDNRCRSDGSYLCALFCSYTHFINFNLYKVMKLCWNQSHFSQAEGWSKPRTPHQSITRLYRHKKTESKSPIQCTCVFWTTGEKEEKLTNTHIFSKLHTDMTQYLKPKSFTESEMPTSRPLSSLHCCGIVQF